MQRVNTTTYVQRIADRHSSKKEDRLLILSQEAANVYNTTLDIFWKSLDNQKWLGAFTLQKEIRFLKRKMLHSDSYVGSIQQFAHAAISWKKAKDEYAKNPGKFTGPPQPPTEHKNTCPIFFKQSAIHYKKGFLLLSLAKGYAPIKIKWNISIGIPVFATIVWNPIRGWQANFVFEKNSSEVDLDKTKILGADLGTKRIGTTFDGKRTITYSGKKLMSLTRLRSKVNGKTSEKLSKLKKHSLQYKKIKRANRKVVNRIQNKVDDILHKYSRTIVNYCKDNQIGKVVFGDCAGIHTGTNLGVNNQKVQQCPEQKLRKYVEYKFSNIGGLTDKVQESYTSKTCPKCGKLNHAKNRLYKCSGCGFCYDRDGVGSLNIWGLSQNVSLGQVLSVVGDLTTPIGYKYYSSLDCIVNYH